MSCKKLILLFKNSINQSFSVSVFFSFFFPFFYIKKTLPPPLFPQTVLNGPLLCAESVARLILEYLFSLLAIRGGIKKGKTQAAHVLSFVVCVCA